MNIQHRGGDGRDLAVAVFPTDNPPDRDDRFFAPADDSGGEDDEDDDDDDRRA